jgi:hypothetical protein
MLICVRLQMRIMEIALAGLGEQVVAPDLKRNEVAA